MDRLTRKQRNNLKRKAGAKINNVTLCSINFMHEDNVAHLIRTAACFGANVSIVGSLPDYRTLVSKSGTANTIPELKLNSYSNPSELLNDIRSTPNSHLICAELTDNSKSIVDYVYPKDKHIFIVVGHETFGVPVEFLHHANDVLFIPMPGFGYCLNTSQTANIMMFDYVSKMKIPHVKIKS